MPDILAHNCFVGAKAAGRDMWMNRPDAAVFYDKMFVWKPEDFKLKIA